MRSYFSRPPAAYISPGSKPLFEGARPKSSTRAIQNLAAQGCLFKSSGVRKNPKINLFWEYTRSGQPPQAQIEDSGNFIPGSKKIKPTGMQLQSEEPLQPIVYEINTDLGWLQDSITRIFDGWVYYQPNWQEAVDGITSAEVIELINLCFVKYDYARDANAEFEFPSQAIELLGLLARRLDDVPLLNFLKKLFAFIPRDFQSPFANSIFNMAEPLFKKLSSMNRSYLAEWLFTESEREIPQQIGYLKILNLLMEHFGSHEQARRLVKLCPRIWDNLYSKTRLELGRAAKEIFTAHFWKLKEEDQFEVAKSYIGQLQDPIAFQRLAPDEKNKLIDKDDSLCSRAKAIPAFFKSLFSSPGYLFKDFHLKVAMEVARVLIAYAPDRGSWYGRDQKDLNSFIAAYFVFTRQIYPVWESIHRLDLVKAITDHVHPHAIDPVARGVLMEALDPQEVQSYATQMGKQRVSSMVYLEMKSLKDALPQSFPALKSLSWG